MSIRLYQLDCTDFLLTLEGRKPILVHEWEGIVALTWHIAELALDNEEKPLQSRS